MSTPTQDQIANILLTRGTESQQQEALEYIINSPSEIQYSTYNWFLSAAPLEDGWYWRKETEHSNTPDIIEVVGGFMLDKYLMINSGVSQENTCVILQNFDFQDYWFSGPLEAPRHNRKEYWDCHGL